MPSNRKRRYDDDDVNNKIPKIYKTDDVYKNDIMEEANDHFDEDIDADNEAMNTEHSVVNDISYNYKDDDKTKILTRAILQRKPVKNILKIINLDPLAVQKETLIGKYYPLHMACMYYEDDDDLIMKLLELYPLALQKKDIYGKYPIHYVLEYKQSENVIIKFMEMFPLALEKQDIRGRIPLHYAFERSHLFPDDNIIVHLIDVSPMSVRITEYTSNINFNGRSHGLALHYACKGRHSIVMIEKLIDLYPEAVHVINDFGKYPIHCAIERATERNETSFEVINLLMNSDPLVFERRTTYESNSTLHQACIHGLTTLVEYMIQHPNCFINIKNAMGETPLYKACIHSRHEVVQKLLQHPDINVNVPDNNGDSPLHTYLDLRMFEQLLKHPYIDVNAKDQHGRTPLDIIKKELKTPINFYMVDGTERQPVDLIRIVKLIEEILHKRRWEAFQYLLNS